MKIDIKKEYHILTSQGQECLDLGSILEKTSQTILYFYPKDNTPGCSVEAKDFSCLLREFLKKGVQVVGVSKDSLVSHQKFTQQLGLLIPLISDTDLTLHKEFGVYGEKKNYGKVSLGVIRSTFLLDQKGNIVKEWRNVKATGHAQKVLDFLGN